MGKFSEALERWKEISETLDPDDPDKLEVLDAEDFTELMNWAVYKYNEYKAQEDAANALAEKYKKRSDMFKRGAEDMKGVMTMMLNAAGERKHKCVAGTVSLKTTPPKVIITDEYLLDDSLFDIKKVVNKTRVKNCLERGDDLNGAAILSNGGETIAVRV